MDDAMLIGVDDEAYGVQVRGLRFICLSADQVEQQAETLCGFISASPAATAQINTQLPWLPSATQKAVGQHFCRRLQALFELNQLRTERLRSGALTAFHSRYKLLLLAHSQPLYREIGPLVAGFSHRDDPQAFFREYRLRLMALLARPASRADHTNALMHMQGYFRGKLDTARREALTQQILDYREGHRSLDEPLALIRQYLALSPDDYLAQQRYLQPLPPALAQLSGGRP
ncbi:DUF1722 domain-containing protein [Erwinia sp. CPCC 100877]|nr:DUF1722 domain-containing protein [Erwinia sp. CPCC 100877]